MSDRTSYMTPEDIIPTTASISSYPAPDLTGLYGACIYLQPVLLPALLGDDTFAPEESEIYLCYFRLPSLDAKCLELRTFTTEELTRETRYEGSVCLQAEHHWVVLRQLAFGEHTEIGIIAHYELEFNLYFCNPQRFTKTLTVDTSLCLRTPE